MRYRKVRHETEHSKYLVPKIEWISRRIRNWILRNKEQMAVDTRAHTYICCSTPAWKCQSRSGIFPLRIDLLNPWGSNIFRLYHGHFVLYAYLQPRRQHHIHDHAPFSDTAQYRRKSTTGYTVNPTWKGSRVNIYIQAKKKQPTRPIERDQPHTRNAIHRPRHRFTSPLFPHLDWRHRSHAVVKIRGNFLRQHRW